MGKLKIRLSVCTYSDGRFEALLIDEETLQEVQLEGNKALTEEEFELLQRVAPGCVLTPYQQL